MLSQSSKDPQKIKQKNVRIGSRKSLRKNNLKNEQTQSLKNLQKILQRNI